MQLHPVVRDECKEKKCVKLAKHFEHCQEKVQGGEGFKGEDCVEELYVTVPIARDCEMLTTLLPAVRGNRISSTMAFTDHFLLQYVVSSECSNTVHMMHCIDVRLLLPGRTN